MTTWYYDEEHMPTGYLMNALVTVPDADKGAVTGLCHATTGADARFRFFGDFSELIVSR